ncbi:MAG: hypothetical protein ACREC9_12995, partial [Methylocella sp.]
MRENFHPARSREKVSHAQFLRARRRPLVTFVAMDIVLGVDTLVFTGILLAKLPPVESARSGRAGTGLSLVLRALLVMAQPVRS